MMLKTLMMMALVVAAQAPSDPHLPGRTVDSVAPTLPAGLQRGVLIVSKTNGWRHIEHIPHSNAVLAGIAKELGHASFTTENAAIFNDDQLSRFSVVVLNSASGDFLSAEQQAAFARFVARGGGVVAAWWRCTRRATTATRSPGMPIRSSARPLSAIRAARITSSPRGSSRSGRTIPCFAA
ncbi:ThuA domain-containing protein [Sphingomonas sp. 1185]|uniref:ThuA domain-containing protein n=1 Tax=Sphingomonas sp. 1185 TaxID=3156411 RepID=UPI0033914E7E